VLQADGGTRTAAVTGGFVALVDCLRRMQRQELLLGWPLLGSVAAVSVGIVSGGCLLDLNYAEDTRAEVDMNVVMAASQGKPAARDARWSGRLVEIQGTAEPTYDEQARTSVGRRSFSQQQLLALLKLARKGIAQLTSLQYEALGEFPLSR
jgi:ribonuclease PH